MSRSWIAFLICLLVLAAVFALVTHPINDGINGSIIVVALSAFGIIPLIIMMIRAGNPYIKLAALLNSNCSPEAFIIETQTMLSMEKVKKRPLDILKLTVYLSRGHYAAGRYEDALDELMKAAGRFPAHASRSMIAQFFHNLFLIYVELDKLDMARGALGRMVAAAHKLKGKTGRLFKQRFIEGIYLIRVATGVFENAEDVFKNSFKSAQTNYERVLAAFTLGKVYGHLKKDAEEKDAYVYVVEHGEKLHIAKLAAEHLGLK